MNDYTVSFFGHRKIDNAFRAEKLLNNVLEKILADHRQVLFLVGRNGEFDQLVSSSVKRMKRKVIGEDALLTCVLPYLTAEYRDNEKSFQAYYDEIELCEKALFAHPKAAFHVRNQSMIDRSDLCVFFVEHAYGGAFEAMSYAEKKKKPMINLAE